jgi:hypothetical protein
MGGKTVRVRAIGAHLMTGEFVYIPEVRRKRWVFKILDVCSYDRLPSADKQRWENSSDRDDFVLAQWCAVVGEDDDDKYATSKLPMDDLSKVAGLREIVLLPDASWHPIECVVDAVIVLPAMGVLAKDVDVVGMDNVFVVGFEEHSDGLFSPIDINSVGAFAEENDDLGVDDDGDRLVQDSRTAKLCSIRLMLRNCINTMMRPSRRLIFSPRCTNVFLVGKSNGLVNGVSIPGVDSETWSIISVALRDVSQHSCKSAKKGFVVMTKSYSLGRRVTNSTRVVISCTMAAALALLDGFLGYN